VALDITREFYELGLPMIKKAGVIHKIDFREGHALFLLDQLLQDVSLHFHIPTRFHNFFYKPCTIYKLKINKCIFNK
jgi:hypothetical protein